MRHSIRRVGGAFAFALVALFSLSAHRSIGGEAKAADPNRPPELRPLDRWPGTWDLELTVKPGGWVAEGSKGSFVMTNAWDLHGRFIRCEAKGKTAVGNAAAVDDSFLWFCTYDPQYAGYRSWVFWSMSGGPWGATPVASGEWDEAKRTMTWTSVEAGTTHLGVTRWIDDDTHEFVNTYKDADGKVMMEQVGKAKRRK
jgi:hypothetical protein